MPYHMHYHPTSSQIAFCFVAAPRYDDRDWGELRARYQPSINYRLSCVSY